MTKYGQIHQLVSHTNECARDPWSNANDNRFLFMASNPYSNLDITHQGNHISQGGQLRSNTISIQQQQGLNQLYRVSINSFSTTETVSSLVTQIYGKMMPKRRLASQLYHSRLHAHSN